MPRVALSPTPVSLILATAVALDLNSTRFILLLFSITPHDMRVLPRQAAPHMRVGPRGRALLSRVRRPPQWRAARAGGADITPTSGFGPTPPGQIPGIIAEVSHD